MKLSKETLDVLKNFAAINGGILIEPGKVISTKRSGDDILANYIADEKFPVQVALYDLNLALGVVSVFSQPEFEFHEDFMVVSEEKNPTMKNVVMYSDPSFITRPNAELKLPPFDAELNITQEILTRLDKLSAIQNLDQYMFEGTADNEVYLKAINIKNPDSNNFSVLLGENALGKPFKMIFGKSTFVFLPGDYTVKISTKKVAHFIHTSMKLEYYVMADVKSKFT